MIELILSVLKFGVIFRSIMSAAALRVKIAAFQHSKIDLAEIG